MYWCHPLIWIVFHFKFSRSTFILWKNDYFNFFNEHKVPLANKKKKDKDVKNPCPNPPPPFSTFLEILDVARISMFLLFLINYQAVVSDLAEEDRYTVQQTYTCNTYNNNLCKLLHILEIKPLSMNNMC